MATGIKNTSSSSSSPNNGLTKKWGVRAIVIAGIAIFYSFMNSINHKFYRLTTTNLHSAVHRAIAHADSIQAPGNATVIIEKLLDTLVDEHPDMIFNKDFKNKDEWVFNNAGGAMGSMYLVHASISEYLIIFGTAVGTEGHTGRHTADDFFFILTGQQTAYDAGELTRQIYNPGDVNHMKRGVVRQYGMAPESWALEYAQGWIPLMLPFGFADTFSSTFDFITLYHTVRITGREMIKNLLVGKI